MPVEPVRKPLMSGNWKMHHNHLEAIQVVQKLSYALNDADYDAVDVSVHPPFTALRSIQTVLDADRIPILLGAQDERSATDALLGGRAGRLLVVAATGGAHDQDREHGDEQQIAASHA